MEEVSTAKGEPTPRTEPLDCERVNECIRGYGHFGDCKVLGRAITYAIKSTEQAAYIAQLRAQLALARDCEKRLVALADEWDNWYIEASHPYGATVRSCAKELRAALAVPVECFCHGLGDATCHPFPVAQNTAVCETCDGYGWVADGPIEVGDARECPSCVAAPTEEATDD